LLHAGHALSAIIAHDTARTSGGRFLLRIEDIDVTRARPEFKAAIFEDLGWLGLTWEEPVLVQSQHFPEYLAAADRLIAQGLLYPCFQPRRVLLLPIRTHRSRWCAPLSWPLEERTR
jgi:glutamyl-Q tRNA(Asp) synthetase